MAASLIPVQKGKQYLGEGLTYEQAAARLLREEGIDVNPNAFANFRRRHGFPTRQASGRLPWRLRSDHTHSYDAMVLRLYTRREVDGQTLPDERDNQRVNKLLRELHDHANEHGDAVIRYERDGRGLIMTERLPEDDPSTIFGTAPDEVWQAKLHPPVGA